jgi:hypothetical protein
VISAVSRSDDRKALIVRIVSLANEATTFTINFNNKPVHAMCVDYLDKPIAGSVLIDSNSVTGSIDPSTIQTIRISF